LREPVHHAAQQGAMAFKLLRRNALFVFRKVRTPSLCRAWGRGTAPATGEMARAAHTIKGASQPPAPS